MVTSLMSFAEFVNRDCVGENITPNEVEKYFSIWFNTGNSTFVLFNERVDNLGFLHQNYQQYVDGIKVEDCALIVHSKGGYVTYVNGDIMPIANKPQSAQKLSASNAKKIAGIVNKESNPEMVFIYKQLQDTSIFYKVYKVVSDTEHIYVDVETGEVIAAYPTISYAMKDCTIPTMYSGVRNVSCDYTNSKYYLYDSNRKINVKYADMGNYNAPPETSYSYTSSVNDWAGNYLSSVTIKSVNNNWWGILGLEDPDLYVEVLDQYGNQLYITDYKEDVAKFPVTFRFSEAIRVSTNGGLIIRIFDNDVSEDQLGATITLSDGNIGTYSWGSSSSNTSGSLVISNSVPSYDAYWGTIKAYDFYKDFFGLSSFDGKDSPINVYLHSPHILDYKEDINYKNALAYYDLKNSSNAFLFFAVGDEMANPLVGFNVVAHEYTHLVTAYRPNGILVYQGESGAINEGYSDVMGEVAEYYINGDNDWLYDTESKVYGYSFGRDLSNPNNAGLEGKKPTTYGKGDAWINPTDTTDKGGVHANNSIFTYWFYLLSEGGRGTNDNNDYYEVKGIGIELAAKIAWRMHQEYLPKKCTFAEARVQAIKSVRDLSDGAVGTPAEESVINAWYAVGVGEKYVAPKEEFQLKPGKYVIVANRVADDKNNWYYMTSDLGTAGTKRFQAISAGVENIDAITTNNLEDKYIWELVADGSNWKLKNGNQYVSWNSGNSASLDATGKSLTFDITENQVIAHFNDGSAERYLSLHVGNDYFAFYANTGQIEQLYFLPCEEGQQPPVEEPADEFIVLAQRNENSNWFYMTADLGTAGTKRFQAIDAGTPNKALINTSPTDAKYIWSFEEVDGGVALVNGEQYASWKSGNSAILSTTPMALNIIDVSEDQVNMSFVDGEGYTRYLSLNATAGNNYFAFYKGTTQKCNLLIIPYGEKITTDIDVILSETPIIHKVIRDGQLLIIRDGKTYNAQGILINY